MAVQAASLANLTPVKPGQKLNTTGNNGYYRRQLIHAVLDEADDDDPNIPRIRAVVLAMVRDAKRGESFSPSAGKTLCEYYSGQPAKAPDSLAIAEHFRQVERDKIQLALAILGPRIQGMDPIKLAEFFRACASNPLGFMAEAEKFLRGEGAEPEPQTVEALPPTPLDEEPAK